MVLTKCMCKQLIPGSPFPSPKSSGYKAKKGVTGDVFMCSCRTSTSATIATALCNERRYLATWLTSSSYKCSILEATCTNQIFIRIRFLCRGINHSVASKTHPPNRQIRSNFERQRSFISYPIKINTLHTGVRSTNN